MTLDHINFEEFFRAVQPESKNEQFNQTKEKYLNYLKEKQSATKEQKKAA